MRSFRVSRASRPALLALRVGLFEDLNVLGYRSSSSWAYSRQLVQFSTGSKRLIFIAGAPPTLSKLVKLSQFTAAGVAQYSTGSSRGSRRKDPSLLYGAGWEGGGEDVAVAVWWDFENCNVPQGIEVYKVGVNIVSGLRLSGFKGPVSISAYGDTVQLSRTTQEALASTGIRLHHIPSGGKDSSDRALLVDLILWTLEHPPPAHLFLISGDRDFSNALHRLRMRNYNVLLACPAGTTVSPALLGAATHVWQWNSLVRGEGLLLATTPDFRPPDGSPGGGSFSRHGGPRPYNPSYLPPVSKGYDGSGHSSEGGGMPTPPTPGPAIPSSSVQSRTVEGNGSSVAVVKKPATVPVSPSQSSQKQALKDTAQASVASEEGSSAKPILRRPPQKLLQQFKSLLSSHPSGMMLSDLQNYIREGKLNLEKDFYGHGKVIPFLSSIPEIVQVERVLMKDYKSWSYNLLTPRQDGTKSRTKEPLTAKEVGAQTQSWQAIEQTPAASEASSQTEVATSNSTQMQQERPASPISLCSVQEEQAKILSTDASLKAGTAQAFSGEASRFSESDIEPRDHGKDDKEVDLPSVSKTQTSVLEANQKASNMSEAAVPSFMGSFVEALKNLRKKETEAENPNLPQQVDVYRSKRNSAAEQLSISDTASKLVRGELEVDGPCHGEEVAKAGIKDGDEGLSPEDASNVRFAEKQLVSEGMYERSEVVTSDGASALQANNLQSGLSESGGTESAPSIVTPVVQKKRTPAWKRWLFGPTSEEAPSTSGVDFRASPELNQASWSDAVTTSLRSEEAKADSKPSLDSFSTSEEIKTSQPASAALRSGTADGRDEESLWGHSFVIQNSKIDGTSTMKVWEDLKEYVSSAEGSLLLSDASNMTEAINLIRMKGPLQFRYLDSNEIADIIRPLVEVQGGLHWESLHEGVTSGGSVADLNEQLKAQVLDARPSDLPPSVESVQGHAAETPVEIKNHVHSEFQQEGKETSNEIISDAGYGSIMLKKEEIDGHARDEPRPGEGAESSGQEAWQDQIGPSTVMSPAQVDEASSSKTRNGNLLLDSFDRGDSSAVRFEDTPDSGQQSSEASTSHSATSFAINRSPPVHPNFEEFEEWVLRVVNNAYRRSGRNQRAGYDLSLVKPDFEREFGVRLDPKAYGFFRVQDLVASISSVRLSRPRIDQCVIHLLKFDAEVQELAIQYHEEQAEETVVTKSEIWPKMVHDCKSLVRELMLENPDGVSGTTLKPMFASRFNYLLDHRRVGYQRMSDLLRLMPDVVSVNGNLLVPSEELLRTVEKEAKPRKRVPENVMLDAGSDNSRDDEFSPETGIPTGENWSEIDKEADGSSSSEDTNAMKEEAKSRKRVPENVMLDAGSENSRDDEFSPETGIPIGENWSEIDKEADGSSSSEDSNAQHLEDGRRSSDKQSSESGAFEKLSISGEFVDDLSSSSEDESDFANEASEVVDSQAEQFQSFMEEFQRKELRRTAALSQVSEEKKGRGSTRSSRPSREYDFSQEIDEILLEDDHVEQWMAENRPDETQEDTVDSQNSELEDSKQSHRLTLDGHLHEDWSTELMKDDIQQPRHEPFHSYSDGSAVYQDEETNGVTESRGEELSPGTSGAGEEHASIVEETSRSDSGVASRDRDGLVSVTSTSAEQNQEEYNSKSLELMRILQRKEGPSKLLNLSESPQVGLSRVESTEESGATTTGEEPTERTRESDSSPRYGCVASPAADNSQDPDAPCTQEEEDKIESVECSATENAKDSISRDKSGEIDEEVQHGDNPRGSSSSEAASSRSIWRRLFK